MKIISFLLLITTYNLSFSQEDSLRAHVNRMILPDNKVESYIDVNDSIDLFIDAFEKRFGEVEEQNGVYNWSGVEIDSIGKNLKIKMLHGIWTTKKNEITFNPISPEKAKKIKSNEKRGVRIRFFLKDGKDALISKANEIILIQIIESMLNSSTNTQNE